MAATPDLPCIGVTGLSCKMQLEVHSQGRDRPTEKQEANEAVLAAKGRKKIDMCQP